MRKAAGLAKKSFVNHKSLYDPLMNDGDSAKCVINDVLSQKLPHAIKYLYFCFRIAMNTIYRWPVIGLHQIKKLLSFSRSERWLNTEKEAIEEGLPSFQANFGIISPCSLFSTSLQHNIEHSVILLKTKTVDLHLTNSVYLFLNIKIFYVFHNIL